jgi:hypothetical protein
MSMYSFICMHKLVVKVVSELGGEVSARRILAIYGIIQGVRSELNEKGFICCHFDYRFIFNW